MKVVYPILVKQDENCYLVYIPDFDGYTEGNSFIDALEMAKDYIGLSGIHLEDEKKSLPDMSTEEEARNIAKEKSDGDFDFSNGTLAYVDVDLKKYRSKVRNLSVKKNCTIPMWLSEEAEEAGINFSRVLQEALVKTLGSK